MKKMGKLYRDLQTYNWDRASSSSSSKQEELMDNVYVIWWPGLSVYLFGFMGYDGWDHLENTQTGINTFDVSVKEDGIC